MSTATPSPMRVERAPDISNTPTKSTPRRRIPISGPRSSSGSKPVSFSAGSRSTPTSNQEAPITPVKAQRNPEEVLFSTSPPQSNQGPPVSNVSEADFDGFFCPSRTRHTLTNRANTFMPKIHVRPLTPYQAAILPLTSSVNIYVLTMSNLVSTHKLDDVCKATYDKGWRQLPRSAYEKHFPQCRAKNVSYVLSSNGNMLIATVTFESGSKPWVVLLPRTVKPGIAKEDLYTEVELLRKMATETAIPVPRIMHYVVDPKKSEIGCAYLMLECPHGGHAFSTVWHDMSGGEAAIEQRRAVMLRTIASALATVQQVNLGTIGTATYNPDDGAFEFLTGAHPWVDGVPAIDNLGIHTSSQAYLLNLINNNKLNLAETLEKKLLRLIVSAYPRSLKTPDDQRESFVWGPPVGFVPPWLFSGTGELLCTMGWGTLQFLPRGCGYDVFPSFMMRSWGEDEERSTRYVNFYAWSLGFYMRVLAGTEGTNDYVSKSGIYGTVYSCSTNPAVWKAGVEWILKRVPQEIVKRVLEEVGEGKEGMEGQDCLVGVLAVMMRTEGCNFMRDTVF